LQNIKKRRVNGMTDDTEPDELNITDKHRKRFRELQQRLKDADPGLPEPTDEQVMKGLLDTWDAVENGHYTKGYTPNDELRALVDRLQSVEGKNDILSEVSHYPERGRTDYVYCTVDAVVSELEALLDDTQAGGGE